VGIFSIFAGVVNLRYPDLAWKLAQETASRKGKAVQRSKHWDNSRIFSGTMTLVIGVLLIGGAGWRYFQPPTAPPIQTGYIDPVTGKTVVRELTPAEAEQYNQHPNDFLQKVARNPKALTQ
jgi:hypothetical protein